MIILVINCGSSSVKYQVIDMATGQSMIKGKIERIGAAKSHADAITEILNTTNEFRIEAVGHRVVHGGEEFFSSVVIDEKVINAIEACIPLAPLHNPANLEGIRATRELLHDIPHVAVFDTAFHNRMPRRAKTYAIPKDIREQGVRRFGFHGTSHRIVTERAAGFLRSTTDALKIITLHLGNGCSACAVEYGHSVDTSMGQTPLEGLVMGTRSGDLDPGIVLALARDVGIDEADNLLNRHSGLKGLSDNSNDLRDILDNAALGDEDARLAIAVFAHRVRKYIGAYAAIMGGVDAIVLTGGIGENSPQMRHRILQRLDFLGVSIDDDGNQDARVSEQCPVVDISNNTARVRTLVVATNEELKIAEDTAALVASSKTRDGQKKPIPVAVSARHVHLTQPALEVLFGKDHELTPYKPLSQPGQFASEERVSIIGPRGRIDKVRILGPLRSACQIEVSRTDEFALGVDAPIRRSGQVQDSASITLEGPNGILHLKQGLICAWRHIHMTTKDARAYGVSDGDMVEVAITTGPRDLTFGDVLVRVKDSYKLEMHIDTDEANAAELSPLSHGELIFDEVYIKADTGRAIICPHRYPQTPD